MWEKWIGVVGKRVYEVYDCHPDPDTPSQIVAIGDGDAPAEYAPWWADNERLYCSWCAQAKKQKEIEEFLYLKWNLDLDVIQN